nr:tyrosine-type recombinase/integrase [Mycobacterium mantenii]
MTKSLLTDMLPSWQLSLRAERKSPGTISTYTDGVRKFLRWCEETGTPAELTKLAVQEFLADLLDQGAEANTAKSRDLALKRYAKWLVNEGELSSDPLLGLKPPKGDQKVVQAVTEDQLRRMIIACQGKSLTDRRDEAIIRLMAETGIRTNEVLDLQVPDVNLTDGLVTILRGKGGKGRVSPFSVQTASAIDRYLRARRAHRLSDTGALWLGGGGKGLGYHGLRKALKLRANAAGVENFHLHMLRHTAAIRWLSKNGSESGLMSVAGWKNRTMIDRYIGAAAASLAADEARRLNLGDI